MHEFMISQGENVLYYDGLLKVDSLSLANTDFIVSYGYRYILNKEITTTFHHKAINLHISYLPWNRGADPNFWSILEDTPKGVTIHYIDENLDTGDIIVQKEVEIDLDGTLRSSYEQLSEALENLFYSNWDGIKNNIIETKNNSSEYGSFHYKKDKSTFDYLLHRGWDTPIIDIIGEYNKRF